MSVKRAKMEIDSAEFSEWVAYHRINPFTYNGTENILAHIAAMLTNALSKKSARAVRPRDFLPNRKPSKPDTAKEIQAKLKAFFRTTHGNH